MTDHARPRRDTRPVDSKPAPPDVIDRGIAAGPDLVHGRIRRYAVARPGAAAVLLDECTVVDYGMLLRHATELARRLRAVGAGPDRVIGLASSRTADGLAGLLGILLSGSPFLYLDLSLPARRARHLLTECAVGTVVADPAAVVPAGIRRVALPAVSPHRGKDLPTDDRAGAVADDIAPSRTPAAPVRRPPRAAGVHPDTDHRAGPADLAYVVYTSGSTGIPRGVAVEHAAVANMAHQLATILRVGPATRMLQFASWSWDAAVCEILVPLTVGGTVVLAPPQVRHGGEPLAEFLAATRVQVATLTPSVLAATPIIDLPDLHTVVAVGEPCPAEVVARWAAPGRRFLNGYGPTEATVAVSVGQCRPGARVHIGAPIPGVDIRVVDAADRPVNRGERGHLLVSGVGLARGYLTRPTTPTPPTGPASRWTADATCTPAAVATVDGGRFFRDANGVRWFRTGDRVRQRADGTLMHLGRLDDQVQIRGHRVELGEVETTLRQVPGVAACAVTVHGGRLVAHVVPANADSIADPGQILRAARGWLPAHLLPHEVRLVNRLPMTAGGKTDRAALTARPPAARPATAAGAPSAPRPPSDGDAPHRSVANAVLGDVLAVVRQVLQAPDVQATDDVFVAGGHSLLAAELAVAVSTVFGVDVPALAVVDHPTAARLADLIRAATADRRTRLPGGFSPRGQA